MPQKMRGVVRDCGSWLQHGMVEQKKQMRLVEALRESNVSHIFAEGREWEYWRTKLEEWSDDLIKSHGSGARYEITEKASGEESEEERYLTPVRKIRRLLSSIRSQSIPKNRRGQDLRKASGLAVEWLPRRRRRAGRGKRKERILQCCKMG